MSPVRFAHQASEGLIRAQIPHYRETHGIWDFDFPQDGVDLVSHAIATRLDPVAFYRWRSGPEEIKTAKKSN